MCMQLHASARRALKATQPPCTGESQEELFSAPKVQLINLLNKHLTNAPDGDEPPDRKSVV